MELDLYLRDELGLWVLQQIPGESIRLVVTPEPSIFQAARARALTVVKATHEIGSPSPDTVLLSIHWREIFPKTLLDQYAQCLNIHPGYLPWGRGRNSAFWAIWKDEPAGASFHVIDGGIDTGPLVDQINVPVDESTVLSELFAEVTVAEKQLLERYLPKLFQTGYLPSKKQMAGGSSYTHSDYVELIRETREHWRELSSEALIKLLRCVGSLPIYSGNRLLSAQLQPQPRA